MLQLPGEGCGSSGPHLGRGILSETRAAVVIAEGILVASKREVWLTFKGGARAGYKPRIWVAGDERLWPEFPIDGAESLGKVENSRGLL